MATANDIIAAIRARIDRIENPLLIAEINNNTDDMLCRSWFRNYRAGEQPKGLRLTNTGLVALKSIFACHTLYLGGDYRVKNHHLIFLDRICNMPWHLEGQHLTVFDKQFAFRFKIVGNMDTFITTYKDMSTKFATPLRKDEF